MQRGSCLPNCIVLEYFREQRPVAILEEHHESWTLRSHPFPCCDLVWNHALILQLSRMRDAKSAIYQGANCDRAVTFSSSFESQIEFHSKNENLQVRVKDFLILTQTTGGTLKGSRRVILNELFNIGYILHTTRQRIGPYAFYDSEVLQCQREV